MKKSEVIYCCQKCGTVQVILEKINNQKQHCPFCDSIMRKVPYFVSTYEHGIDKKYKTWQDVVRKEYAKPKHRNDELFAKREIEDLNKEKSPKHYDIVQKTKQEELRKLKSNSNISKPIKTVVKCPYCHSDNTKKISTTSKVINTVIWGPFGSKRFKEWHCNKCNSDF